MQMSLFEDNHNIKQEENNVLEKKEYLKNKEGIIFCSENDFLNENFLDPILYYDEFESRIIGIDPSREPEDNLFISICSTKDNSLKKLKDKYPSRVFNIQKIDNDEIPDIENNIAILEKLKDKKNIKNFIENKINFSKEKDTSYIVEEQYNNEYKHYKKNKIN